MSELIVIYFLIGFMFIFVDWGVDFTLNIESRWQRVVARFAIFFAWPLVIVLLFVLYLFGWRDI